MFFNFEPNLIVKFVGKVLFQILVPWLFCETEIRFLAAILKRKLFWLFFLADIWLFWVYAHMVQVSNQNSYGKVLKPPVIYRHDIRTSSCFSFCVVQSRKRGVYFIQSHYFHTLLMSHVSRVIRSTHVTLVSSGWLECPYVCIMGRTFRDCQISRWGRGGTQPPINGKVAIKSLFLYCVVRWRGSTLIRHSATCKLEPLSV